jgi:hypothetical protein
MWMKPTYQGCAIHSIGDECIGAISQKQLTDLHCSAHVEFRCRLPIPYPAPGGMTALHTVTLEKVCKDLGCTYRCVAGTCRLMERGPSPDYKEGVDQVHVGAILEQLQAGSVHPGGLLTATCLQESS